MTCKIMYVKPNVQLSYAHLSYVFHLTPQAQLSLQGTFFSFLIMLNSELCAWGVKLRFSFWRTFSELYRYKILDQRRGNYAAS